MSDALPAARRPIWLKVLIAVALLVAALNVGVYVYGLTLPSEWRVEESVVVAAEPAEVYDLIVAPKRWAEWTVWNRDRDDTLEFSFDGPETGKDASFSWEGERVGFGKLTITEAEPNAAVAYDLDLGGADFSDAGRIRLEPVESGTRVVWTDGGELSGTLGRIFGRRLERDVAADFAASLKNLKTIAEAP